MPEEMSLDLSYMGTKKTLAPLIASIVKRSKDGIFLDCFAGMCAVGREVAPGRPVWTNDTELFAQLVGQLLFVAPDHPPRVHQIPDLLFDNYLRNRAALSRVFGKEELLEQEALQVGGLGAVRRSTRTSQSLLSDGLHELQSLRTNPRSFPYS